MLCFRFFFEQKTAYELRISDWSSDVCSSDLLAPLAVSSQMVREAEKFGIPAHLGDGEGICVTNYQKLDHFDLSKFGAVILDESSILKSTDGHYRTKLIQSCQSIPFRQIGRAHV